VVFHGTEEDILEQAKKAVDRELDGMTRVKFEDPQVVQRHVVQALGTFWRAETGRRPFILPVVREA